MSQNWYLMAFGVELGPMTWDDLRQRGSRGDLRPDSQVRQGEGGALIRARDVPGLCGPTAHPPRAIPQKKAKKAAGPAVARPRTPIRLPGKPLAVVAGAALVACAGYFGWAHWPPRSVRPDYRQVVALYRQAHEQIKQFRSNPQNQSPAGLQFQFSRIVAALRKQLEPLSGDSSAGQLVEAGTQLTQMLVDCQAAGGSAEATRFADNEQRFLAILNSYQGRP
ncbi:MAG TPA: DUF4339 domain-containing protein [Pirellulales bacterium]|jgi:hypothetical protein|nr:DUF4339 domain-containing protein [Pirellulales bacterium]